MEFKHGQGQNLCCLFLAFIIELRISNRIYLVLRICCLPSFAWQLERRKRPLLWRLEQQLYQRLLQSSGLCCTPLASWAETSSGKPVSDERFMAGRVKISYHCTKEFICNVCCRTPSEAMQPRLETCTLETQIRVPVLWKKTDQKSKRYAFFYAVLLKVNQDFRLRYFYSSPLQYCDATTLVLEESTANQIWGCGT